MITMNTILRTCLTIVLLLTPRVAAAEACRLALVLALDVSGSVNEVEYNQQIDGLATALNDADVRSLILFSADAPVSLAVFEWSSRNHQFIIQPWISLRGPAELDQAILRIRQHQRVRAGLKTAMGTALEFGAAMLDQQAHCWLHTIDVSGDGKNNIGITPQDVYRTGLFDRITVNALVVGHPNADAEDGFDLSPQALREYYDAEVIHGQNAFSMIADGYGDYAAAMQRKLVRELAFPVLGQVQVD